jgi:hypothetical protein
MGARAKFIHRARLSPREPGLAVADFSAFNPLKSRFLKIAFAFLCFDHVAGNLSKAGWSLGCVSAVDSQGRTIWIADAHRDDGSGENRAGGAMSNLSCHGGRKTPKYAPPDLANSNRTQFCVYTNGPRIRTLLPF